MTAATITPVETGPRAVSLRAVVRARAEELFALLANPHRHHEVDGTGTVKERVTGPTSLAAGDRFTVSMEYYNTPYQLTSTVTRVVPDRLIEWQHPVLHTWRWEFEPTAEGDTLVTETFDYSQTPSAPVYELIGIPDLNRRGIRASLERLAARFSG